MIKQFPSKLRGNTHAYQLVSCCTESWNRRGSKPLSSYLMEYKTYGDSMVQHSPAWCVQWENLNEACLSLTDAILANPSDPEWGTFASSIANYDMSRMKFAMSIKYKEGVSRYYSLQEMKLTTANKQHDKRYERVLDIHDGTEKSAFKLMGQSYDEWLHLIVRARRLRDLAYEEGLGYGSWEHIMPETEDLIGDWQGSLVALIYACEAVAKLAGARGCYDCAMHNTQNDIERKAEALAKLAKAEAEAVAA